jgi:hypothetical protein
VCGGVRPEARLKGGVQPGQLAAGERRSAAGELGLTRVDAVMAKWWGYCSEKSMWLTGPNCSGEERGGVGWAAAAAAL